jgi:hypothetical protein
MWGKLSDNYETLRIVSMGYFWHPLGTSNHSPPEDAIRKALEG